MIRHRDDLKAKLNSDLGDQLIEIRDRRRWVEEQWLFGHRVWNGKGYENRFRASDTSSANYNIPFVRKAIERTVVRAGKLLSPNGKQFEVRPIGDVPDHRLANLDMFMQYVVNKRVKKKTIINQLVRCLILYNRCYLKTSVCVRNRQVWPMQRVVDPFSFYLYPETAVTIDEADFVFEDFLISYEKYKTFVGMGIVEDINVSDLTAPVWPYHLSQRLSHQGITEGDMRTVPTQVDKRKTLESMPTPFVALTEVWLTREDRLHQCYLVHNKTHPGIVSFFESSYDEPLYRGATQRSLPNESFTNSMMDDVAELEGVANDQFNKFQDAVDFEQGLVFAAGGKRRDSWKMKGRAVWEMDDPKEDATFVQPSATSPNQLRSWQVVLGLVNAMGATGTIAEGQPGRNMPRSGSAVQNLVSLAMADTQDISELIEQEVLTPALGDLYTVAARFIPDEQLIKIPGGKAIMKKSDFVGTYDFEWVGSLQFQDEQIRAQRLMIFLNMIPQLQPMLVEMGHSFNILELIQTIWRYGLGERGLQKIIMPLEDLQKTMMSEQIERMMLQAQNGAQGGAHSTGQSGGQPRGIGGLQYNMPSVTDGFVQQ